MGAELLLQVFADRYERRSVLITSNLPFGDRLTHKCHILAMNGESYRFRESMTAKKATKPLQ